MTTPRYFPLVDVSGTPHARGVQHGRAVPERVARSIALYKSQLGKRGVDEATLRRLAQSMAQVIEAYDATYLEELRGIAEGAGATLEDVITINCRTEMMFGHADLQQSLEAPAKAPSSEDGDCTGLLVLPGRSATGRLMHAHNWDWREECVDTGIVLRIRREEGPDILSFTEAGALARHGFNANGVSLTGNSLSSDEDFRKGAGVPLVLLRRRVLEAANLAQAMRAIWDSRRYCANNMILAQAGAGDGAGMSLETSPGEIFWVMPEDDLLVHTNHWLCPAARVKLRDPYMGERVDSLYRQDRVENALRRVSGPICWDHVKAILADEFGKPDGVLRSPKPASFASISATVATTLIDAGNKTMWIARKPYEARNFQEYTL
ncbi:isopenicillin-N N-acyltransferase like protein [Variovorax sp. CF079]|uniref:C45 family autoproteolytic acyltransferase/hydolase n=1 Tax=Variovorax sp. CF079 TaxID=1882774 RepID=UPI000885862E|nr:C45 family peptidase [Variovorax sp. CF079]SDE22287.1 isopenicillin-N N-acyltransferase like protein [Variovorax sp. CF079]